MNRFPALIATGLLAACGHALYTTLSNTSTANADQIVGCARQQLFSQGFRQTLHDDKNRRFAAERVVPDAKVSSILFRKRVDLLEVNVTPDPAGNSSLEIRSHTFDEYSNAGGVTRDELKASASARAVADSLMQKCGS